MNSYRIKKERQRTLFSFLLVLSAFLVIYIISFIFNLFKFEDFTDYSGPVKITFGSEDSLIEESFTSEIPQEEEVEPEVVEPEITEPIIEKEEIVDPDPVEEIIPEEVPLPEPLKEERVEKVEPEPVPAPQPVIQKGRESGNSHETSFESSSSKIGRRAYFPIYQFMPLPEVISMDIYALIHGDITGFDDENYNRNYFERFYDKSGSEFKLSGDVPYQNRPELWGILESAGFDLEKAEYKNRNLNQVIITFEINGNSTGSRAIKSAKIEKSSGDSEIDEAVLYGFKQSTYSNSTDSNVKGRFKYSFK